MLPTRVQRVVFHDLMRTAFLCVCAVGVLSLAFVFLITQAFLVNHEYHSLLVQRENDSWLLQQCRFDEFYHRLGHHSRLCDEIAAKQMDPVWLEALRNVLGRAYICGETSCVDFAKGMAEWVVGPGLVFSMFTVLALLAVPTILVPVVNNHSRNEIMRRREEALSKRLL